MGRTRPQILVVEDDALLMMNALNLFEDAGFEVIEATSGEIAVEFLRTNSDLQAVLTDVHLGGEIDGFEVARVARAERPGCEIVVVSGRARPGPGGLPDGVKFVAKPYRAADVLKVFQPLLAAAAIQRLPTVM